MIFGHLCVGASNQALLRFGWMAPHLGVVKALMGQLTVVGMPALPLLVCMELILILLAQAPYDLLSAMATLQPLHTILRSLASVSGTEEVPILQHRISKSSHTCGSGQDAEERCCEDCSGQGTQPSTAGCF